MSEKNKHFISVISATGASTTVDIDLTEEQYELINRLSALILSEADITEPILVISKVITDLTAPDDEAVLPPNG